jgi:hypothetical protein
MATSQSPIDRQPTKLDYASPTQFKFGILQLPKVEFFTVTANVPEISGTPAIVNTPFKNIPTIGDKLEYGNLSISFIVDEYLENYLSLHNWLTGIGFPKSRSQFTTHRDVTSTMPASQRSTSSDIGDVGNATPDKAMYSDANLIILSNKNNPIVEINFQDIFPISLGGLDYTQAATDVDNLIATAEFAYKIYEIKTL